ncbi:MAG: hypothetical protein KKE86_15510 [Planctomycetes bacterium]|nr:hypothetical protein [Planctomycetota bacterium]MBU4400725.1 hypothetical protein [Planctomycetota bacterium]MCG2682898.1 hypothetical protein [Planctomycetales bacterium]
MSDYERIREKLRGKPFLIADADGSVRLANEASTLRAMHERGEFPSALILNVGEALRRFARLRGVEQEDHDFTLRDISLILGVSYLVAWQYVDKKIIEPSIRPFGGSGSGDVEGRFSWADAFAAGAIGTLRRYGFGSDVLRKIQPMFCEPRKRATRRREPAGRS